MKKNLKKIVSLILVLAMALAISVPAFAVEKGNTTTKNQYLCENVANSLSDPNVVELDGYTYKLEKPEIGSFVLSTFRENKLLQKINAKVGQDEFTLTNYNITPSTKSNNTQILKFSDYSKFNLSDSKKSFMAASAQSYVGKVTYRMFNSISGTTYHTLNFYKELYNTYNGDFTLNNGAGELVSIILSAIVGGFAGTITLSVAKGIAVAIGIDIGGNAIKSALSATVNGTVRQYGLIAKDIPTSRTNSYEGTTVTATTWNNNTHTRSTKTYYDDYYPEFISRKDTTVAYWVGNDFWVESMDIYSWN